MKDILKTTYQFYFIATFVELNTYLDSLIKFVIVMKKIILIFLLKDFFHLNNQKEVN